MNIVVIFLFVLNGMVGYFLVFIFIFMGSFNINIRINEMIF